MRQADREQLTEVFREKCRKHDLSITPQRIAVYEALTGSADHPCAEDIFEQVKTSFPDMSVDTVYRTLSTFSKMGIVSVVEGYGEARRYDPDVKRHHHFRCRKCSRIIDFHDKSYDNLKAPKFIKEKCRVSNIKVILEGLCEKCAGGNT